VIKKIILLILGMVSLLLGTIGILLPILPTTPFVILAATCFAVSSPRMNDRLTKSRLFGEFIKNYRDHTGVKRKTKRNALIYLWVMLIISAIIISKIVVCFILLGVGIGVTLHILLLRNAKEDQGEFLCVPMMEEGCVLADRIDDESLKAESIVEGKEDEK
jgi:uncharacterized membrane protein YbaN (DUF454 family)